MIASMTTPKKKTVNRNKHPAWGIRIPMTYRRQVKKLADQTRRTETEEVKIALERYLAEQGLWPPDKPEKQEKT